jgi:putative protein kinase ArgK-like GTPase of G3E family
VKTAALKGAGVAALVDALEKFRRFLEDNGLREKRLQERIEAELIEAAFSDFYDDAVNGLKKSKPWKELVSQVSKRKLDPETATSKLVKIISRTKA